MTDMTHERLSRVGYVESAPAGWPVAYVDEGDVYCEDCMEDALRHHNASCHAHQRLTLDSEEIGAMFTDEEVDAPANCSHCGILFATSLTAEGEEYIRDYARRADADPDILAAYEQAFRWVFSEQEDCANCGKPFWPEDLVYPPEDDEYTICGSDGDPVCRPCNQARINPPDPNQLVLPEEES